MPKYMFVYRGCDNCHEPEEMQKFMQLWMDWIQVGEEAGWLIDKGDGLEPDGAIVNPDLSITDGPFAESKELVGGYSMVEAANIDAAIELAKGSPIAVSGGTVEVRALANVETSNE